MRNSSKGPATAGRNVTKHPRSPRKENNVECYGTLKELRKDVRGSGLDLGLICPACVEGSRMNHRIFPFEAFNQGRQPVFNSPGPLALVPNEPCVSKTSLSNGKLYKSHYTYITPPRVPNPVSTALGGIPFCPFVAK